ncbi:AAA family ATPase [Streptomyces sp. XM4193]|uniref:AAA family ATPase n=1 Tax=Streptomyces sp. XM4193 TaxID=2929782 RepID=UPI001FF9CDC6|nr:AAA family ATPase [Streptomyces sp. XM4193]MCK1796596.1 AAA family ATPase [Streptomyces sp. XM4193]
MTDTAGSRIVFTGGPGSGKTTLVEALAARGFAVVPEAGRSVIRDQLSVGGPALPWQDAALYTELMLAEALRAHRAVEPGVRPVFFDRGVVDVHAYCRLRGASPAAHLRRAATEVRYDTRVFLAPTWPEIYVRDSERRQTYEEAVRTEEACAESYRLHGYEVVPLPRATVAERVDFVLAALNPPRTPDN